MIDFQKDPSDECKNFVIPGVQHKYEPTVLILTTNKCFQYCTHCFRKRNFDKDEEICKDENYKKVFEYISNHSKISNILLSGGDPLTLPTKKLKYIIENIPKNILIRIGTRALTFKPEAFNPIIDILKSRNIQIVSHINSIEDLQKDSSIKMIHKLRSNGINIRSQTVFLRNINDTPEKLINFYRLITNLGIFPYYLFQCRPVTNNEKFVIPIIEGIKIIKETRKYLSGLEKSFRFIASTKFGKIEILDFDSKINILIYKFHQSNNINLIDKVFCQYINKNEIWINHID